MHSTIFVNLNFPPSLVWGCVCGVRGCVHVSLPCQLLLSYPHMFSNALPLQSRAHANADWQVSCTFIAAGYILYLTLLSVVGFHVLSYINAL